MSMVASHLIWLLRTRGIRKRAQESGQAFDESEECMAWQAKGIDLKQGFWDLLARGKNGKQGSESEGSVALEELESGAKIAVPNASVECFSSTSTLVKKSAC